MWIDTHKPRPSLLVISAVSDEETPDGIWAEFYAVEGVLKLLDLEGVTLAGHPGLDLGLLPNWEEFMFYGHIKTFEAKKIRKWLEKGRYTAITRLNYRHKNNGISYRGQKQYFRKSQEAKNREQKLMYSWRDPAQYLTPEQSAWLDAVGYGSFEYNDKLRASIAMGEFVQGLAAKAKQSKPKQRKSKVRAKDRRAAIRKERMLVG